MFSESIQTENQQVFLPILEEKNIEFFVKREDEIHEFVSGNKFRKLKYNIEEAKLQKKNTLLTFGGAYSNHIVATAVAGKIARLKTIGIIRGEELASNIDKILLENATLREAHKNEMQFEFVSREDFRKKNEKDFIDALYDKFGDFYLIPEGGTNELAIKGCEEILTKQDEKFDYICVAVGTGGTVSGLINSAKGHQQIIGFSALKGDFLYEEIKRLTLKKDKWSIQNDYHFGGYGKYNPELIRFINDFKEQTQIPLDPIYTGKMIFGIVDLIEKNYFDPNSKILAIHTGGLQGINGVNKKLIKNNLELIKV
ncbi:1-aminocyclopropane-1-carboxylate deaminase [Tenacibaculum adriaticum]|uniref:1-aminocyclopropane-1-carboxylate deaminase n=1 Tax=Tenacibaculum adriaticum TaxID=413713 RepID=A0A5S5DPJ1_9FLAO|nr:pyridoxal-phosphate dependent enzyme [Tenacibaculum adriaticum]TYP97870.1 1-aminocyclopropane-1-carboxylate deaminase [Tenacibaculum adriaticum]